MRYLILILLNLPIILIALMNIVTQYKLKKVSTGRFRHQIIIWLVMLVVLIGSFPVYNLLSGKPIFDSSELSLFDIVEITMIIVLFYAINNLRQTTEQQQQRLRELHQELSIRMSDDDKNSR